MDQNEHNDQPLDKLARLLAEAVPEGVKSVREDLENNFRSVLKTGLNKLDLVTREEFEVQQAVLSKTRKTLDAMEARLAEIEAADDAHTGSKSGEE